MSYGVKDIDYGLDSQNNPIATSRGPADAVAPGWRYLASPRPVQSFPPLPSYAKVIQDAQRMLAPIALDDPTVGYFSQTFLSKGRTLELALDDGVNNIIVGRRPFSDHDQLGPDLAQRVRSLRVEPRVEAQHVTLRCRQRRHPGRIECRRPAPAPRPC